MRGRFWARLIVLVGLVTVSLGVSPSRSSLAQTSQQLPSYTDSFDYPVGQPPPGWTQHGSPEIVPIIEDVGGNRVLHFPLLGAGQTSKFLVKDGLTVGAATITTKLNFQSNNDEAGLVIAFQDTGTHIAVTANPFWDALVIIESVNGVWRQTASVDRGRINVSTGQNYWLRVETFDAAANGGKTLVASWSTDGVNFVEQKRLTNLASITGQVGYVTWSFSPPHVHFDDLVVSESNRPPTARLTMSTADGVVSGIEGESLVFTVGEGTNGYRFNSTVGLSFTAQRSSDPDGEPLSYEWRLNDLLVSTNRDFTRDLGQGTHNVALTVKDARGAQSTAQGTVIITPRNGATEPIRLSWPFIGTQAWSKTAGNEEGECRVGTFKDHCGDDWFAEDWNWGGADEDRGKVILSPTAGRVIFTGFLGPGYGRQVILQDLASVPADSALRFTHLEATWVTNGQAVCPGTPLGTVGFSGLTRGGSVWSHLHMVGYLGIFQNSLRGSSGYHWLSRDGSFVEAVNVDRPTRFALDFNLDQANRPQGCGDRFALEGRVIRKQGPGRGIGEVSISLTTAQGSTVGTTTTFGDNSGHFAFRELPPGGYTVTPNKSGCQFTPATRTITVQNAHIELPAFEAAGPHCR